MTKKRSKGILFVLSAPSGCGKTTILSEALKRDSHLVRCITYTTREPRPGERNGIDYHFLRQEDFKKKIEEGFFVEWASVYGNYYGTSQQDIETLLDQGKDVMLSVDIQGARTIRSRKKGVFIFLMPPSMEALKERLSGRGTEGSEVLKRRLEQAEVEIRAANQYDYRVINDTIERTTQEILSLIQQERNKE